jgi:hypothetical protein
VSTDANEDADEHGSLVGVSVEKIKALSSDEFLLRLMATPWGLLTLEQIDAIDEDARLSVIANEALTTMANSVDDDEEDHVG